MFDLNDLKKVNDTQGHEVGDRYIKEGCMLICNLFTHSPVYRIGGDEFVAILERDNYIHREELMREFERKIEENRQAGKITIAAGCACFDPETDRKTQSVLERADETMYRKKREMKETTAK